MLPEYLFNNNWTVNWIHHYLPSEITENPEIGLKLLKEINHNKSQNDTHAFLDNFLSIKIIIKVLKSWLFLSLKSRLISNLRVRFNVRDSNINFWYLLKDDWLKSTSGPIAASNCYWVNLFDKALSDLPKQTLGLYLCENQSWEIAMLTFWRKHNHGKIIGFQHATAPFWHLYYFHDERIYTEKYENTYPLPDTIAVNGLYAYEEFLSSGYPVPKIAKVEALRYLEGPTESVSSKKSIKVTNSKNISVLILGELNLNGMKKCYGILQETIKELPDYFEFSYKPHPGLMEDSINWQDIGIETVNESLPELLECFDIIISGNSTSASLQGCSNYESQFYIKKMMFCQ